jgi:Uma2 family endonuclease
MDPLPGKATVRDVARIQDGEGRLYELVDGVLVEKVKGFAESHIAARIIGLLEVFAEDHDLGVITGADGAVEIAAGLVRIPDVSFFSWDHFPNRSLPKAPIPSLVPDLAIEVLSKSNQKAEMDRKLREYFEAGVRLVWYVDPLTRTVRASTAPNRSKLLKGEELLDGGRVLPGLALSVDRLFARRKPEILDEPLPPLACRKKGSPGRFLGRSLAE